MNLNRIYLNIFILICIFLKGDSSNAVNDISLFRKIVSINNTYKEGLIFDSDLHYSYAVELTIKYLLVSSWDHSYSSQSFLTVILKIHQEITGESARYFGVPAALGFTGEFRKKAVSVLNAQGFRVMEYEGGEFVALCQAYIAGNVEARKSLENSEQARLCYEAYYLAPGPSLVKDLMYHYAAELIKRDSQKACEGRCVYAFAAFAHNRFLEIHPFEDANGRTARLIANAILLKNGLPPFDIDRCDAKRKRTTAIFLIQDQAQRDAHMADFFSWCSRGYNY